MKRWLKLLRASTRVIVANCLKAHLRWSSIGAFQEFFVGRAWRSLIMFLGSYWSRHQFNLMQWAPRCGR